MNSSSNCNSDYESEPGFVVSTIVMVRNLPIFIIIVVGTAWLFLSLSFAVYGYSTKITLDEEWGEEQDCFISRVEHAPECRDGPGAGGAGFLYEAWNNNCNSFLWTEPECGGEILAGKRRFINLDEQPTTTFNITDNRITCVVNSDCSKFEFTSVHNALKEIAHAHFITGILLVLPVALITAVLLPVFLCTCLGFCVITLSDYSDAREECDSLGATMKTVRTRGLSRFAVPNGTQDWDKISMTSATSNKRSKPPSGATPYLRHQF